MLFAILTIAGGVLAASSFFIAKKPNAAELFAKVAPYQGFLGIGLLAYGVLELIRAGLPLLGNFGAAPLYAGVLLAAIVLDIAIGFLLGFGLLNKLLLSKNEKAEAKGKEVLQRLARIQVPLGLAAASVGVAVLLKVGL